MSIHRPAFLNARVETQDPETAPAVSGVALDEPPIGKLIRKLSEEDVNQILAYQRAHNVRFGEAAVALKLASNDEVLRALSHQFSYAYSPGLAARTAGTELVVAAHPFGDDAEIFRELRSHLMMGVLAPGHGRALSILSADVADGKSYIAANLAVAFSQLGGRTLLVDADMRTPRQHTIFGIEPANGLSGLLSGRIDGDVIHQITDLPSLFVLPVGATPPNPLELLHLPSFGLLIQELTTKFDYVIVDTPAASHGADARVIAARTGAALLIGREGQSGVAPMQALLKALGKSSTAVAGVVLNDY